MKKQSDELVSYRTCFSTDAGQRVLADILAEGGYFDNDLSTEGEIAVQNFVQTIVKKCGVCHDPNNNVAYVKKLMELPSSEWQRKK
jgi:hypothetical protein